MVASVGIAVSWGKGDDRKTVWINTDAWDDMAELLSEFDRGDAISVTGPRKSREYQGKTYWSITAWELSRPMWKKREAASTKAASPKQDDWDDEEGPPF
jgi:single-stranded DNA-binding protein